MWKGACLKSYHSVKHFYTKSDLQNSLHSEKIILYGWPSSIFSFTFVGSKVLSPGNIFQRLDNISSFASFFFFFSSKMVLEIYFIESWRHTCSDASEKKWCLSASGKSCSLLTFLNCLLASPQQLSPKSWKPVPLRQSPQIFLLSGVQHVSNLIQICMPM